MQKVLIVYYATGRGLALDAEILKAALESSDCLVEVQPRARRQFSPSFLWLRTKLWDRFVRKAVKDWFVQLSLFFVGLFRKQEHDLVIFLERIHWPSLNRAPVSVLIPNQEW